MNDLPDLVRDSELETHFRPDCNTITVHTYHERSPYSRGLISRSEHWRRLQKVGGGGFGTVWLEKCIEGRRDDTKPELRAVKQLDLDRRSTRLDFSRELEAIAKFSQWKYERCFVKSFGWYRSPENLFIAMEYLDMGDLHGYLQQNSPLPESEVKDISYQILDGLCLMHDNGYTHRDLKLNNILVKSCPPNGWWVKIADFGISKRIEDGLGIPTTTKGTSGYMAPELLGFTERGSLYATDIWAVGEIAFRLLTGKSTFANPGLLCKYVDNPGKFPLDSLHVARISQSGVEFILFAMRPVPDNRMTAKEALHHAWVYQSPSEPAVVATPSNGANPNSSRILEPQNEELASWDTITLPKPPMAVLPVRPAAHVQNENVGKGPASSSGPYKPIFGVSLMHLYARDEAPVPTVIYRCFHAIDSHGLSVKGIYQQSGNVHCINLMKSCFNKFPSHDLANPENFYHDVNNVAGLLKLFFLELPDPLLTTQAYANFITASRIDDEIKRRDTIHGIVNSLPDPHYALIRALALHLSKFQEHAARDSISTHSLATFFAPALMGARSNPADITLQYRVVFTIFEHTFQMFDDD